MNLHAVRPPTGYTRPTATCRHLPVPPVSGCLRLLILLGMVAQSTPIHIDAL